MKRSGFLVIVVTVLAALILAACGGPSQPAAPADQPAPTQAAAPTEAPAPTEAAPAEPAEGEPVTIGASLPLTGRFSEPGTAAKQGYEVWAAMVNEAGGLLGRPVELAVLDNASDQDTAVADYEKLITVDKVDLVVGPFSSFLVIPTSEVAARYGYAFVEPAGGAPDVFNRGLTNLFFAQPARGARQADPFTEYILGLPESERPQTFAVVSQDDPFTLGVMNGLKSQLTEGGLELVFDEIYAPETTDFSAIAIQVADLDPDLIVGGTVLEDSIGQIRAYQEAGYEPRGAFFTTGPSLPGPFREALGPLTEGIFAAISWFPEADEYQNAEFVARYVEMFGGSAGDIPEDAANAFTVGQVLQQAVENTGSIDNEALIEELHQGTYQTVVGPLSFDEVGAPQGSFMLLQWQGDNFVIVGPPGREQAQAIGPGGAAPAEPAEGEPVTIGASLPLTGRFSEPGTAAKQGYEVWAAMVNEAGGLLGRPVELAVLDNASDQDTAVADYEKLITVDKVDLVVGPFSSFLVIPTSEVAARYGYAFVEPAGGAPDVFNRGLTNLFFAQPARGARQADPFTEYILGLPESERPQTFAVVSQDDPFTLGVMNGLKSQLTEGGLELVFDEIYAPETTDFSAIAIQVADLDPDLIVGGTVLEDSIGQIRAYQEAGYEPRGAFFTTGPSLPGPFREALGPLTEGIFAAISWFPEADEYQNAEFVARYVEMFGGSAGDIPEDAANAFTVGQVLQQAVENTGSIDNEALIEELHQGTYQTVVGPLSFDEVGAPQGSFMLLQWQGDNFVIVGPPGREQAQAIWPKPEW
ncbi:MAG: amino acid ABC transporter substrate-binding protein [Anaerolineae bacterium]